MSPMKKALPRQRGQKDPADWPERGVRSMAGRDAAQGVLKYYFIQDMLSVHCDNTVPAIKE